MKQGDTLERVEVKSAQALWDWLDNNHGQAQSVWLVTYKKQAGDAYLGRDEVLDALVAYGWIDGVRRKLDEGRTMQLIAPRKQQAWARTYKERAVRLETNGQMHSAGLASVAAGKASGLWNHCDDVDDLVVPDDLQAALGTIAARFAAMAPSYRRNVLRWLKSAKRAETRMKRIDAIAATTREGRRIPQL